MNKYRLHKLIERYMEAETSLDEEDQLRDYLLSLESPDEEEMAALAVMGYAAAVPSVDCKKTMPTRKKVPKIISRCSRGVMLRVAAVIGVITVISASVSLLWRNKHDVVSGQMCIAYVQGVEINDENEVMSLISTQLSEISQTSEEMRNEIVNDFEELSNALINVEI